MDGSTHRLFGLSAGLLAATISGAPAWQAAGTAVIATATAAGWTSPDADQSWLKWLPGHHRGLSHWWGVPALASVLTAFYVPEDAAWAIWALIIGWSSHIVGDFVFGERPPGVPMAPWWQHAGLGLGSGGIPERLLRWAWPAVIAAQVWLFYGNHLGLPAAWPVAGR